MTLIALIICLVILGVVAYLVNVAPVIAQPFKQFIIFALIVIGAIVVISFLISLTGGTSPLYLK